MMKLCSKRLNRRFMAAFIACLAFSALGITSVAAQTETKNNSPVFVDSIVVVVNDEVITHLELQKRLQKVSKRLLAQGKKLPPDNVLKRQVAEQLIIERVQMQKAKEKGIHISDPLLDRAISRIAAQNNLTVQQLRVNLERDGVTFDEFREQVRQDIVLNRLREREVNNKVKVMDSEVDSYLADQGGATVKTEVNLGHILIRIPENASPRQIAESRSRADNVLMKIQSGLSFDQAALSYSEGSQALKGGDLGWRSTDRLPRIFTDAITGLNEGDVSGVIKSPNGFHILKLMARKGEKAGLNLPPVQQIHARHILIKVNQLVTPEDAKRKLTEIKQRLENKAATFDELARLYSNDLSANMGGDLGWLYPGDTVPEFERAMVALKPGEISDPVQTPFGFHLIQVLERKLDEASQDRVRMAVRKAMRERKIAEATEDWLRQLRDSAYVQYRAEL